jgi:hypothetical protein
MMDISELDAATTAPEVDAPAFETARAASGAAATAATGVASDPALDVEAPAFETARAASGAAATAGVASDPALDVEAPVAAARAASGAAATMPASEGAANPALESASGVVGSAGVLSGAEAAAASAGWDLR